MSGKKITILGSSHAHALILGAHHVDVKNKYSVKLLQDFSGMHDVVKDGEDPPSLRDDVGQWIDGSFDADLLLLTISGSDWLTFCASNRDPKIDIILPDRADLDELPQAQLIPLSEMRRRMTERIRHVVRGIEAVRKRMPANIPIWYIAPPPPNPDNDFIARTFPYAGADFARYGVTDPVLRLKMYLLHAAIVLDTCAVNGLPYIAPPPRAMTDDGYLPAELAGSDCLHANERYGRLVIEDIERRVGEL